MHDIQIDFVGDAMAEARGRVSGHAELWRNNQMMVTALRYSDLYRNTETGWKFADRTIHFLYYVPVSKYPDILKSADRNLAYAEPRPADFPEALPSWIAYEKARQRL